MARPDLILTGELRKYHENRTKTPPTAEIELRLELRNPREATALWAQTLHAEETLQGEGREALPVAMNQALASLAKAAAEAIATAAQ